MGSVLRCSLLRCLKLAIISMLVIVVYMFFVVDKENKVNPNTKADFIDPDIRMRQLPKDVVAFHQDAHKNTHRYKPTIFKHEPIDFDHKCVDLKVDKSKTNICVYDRTVDTMISSYITDLHSWEADEVKTMQMILQKNPEMQLLDLGCNVGVYTLAAAKMGRKVIAVDPVKTNLQLLDKSLSMNRLRNKVTLVHNAIADRQDRLRIEIRKDNIGGSLVHARSANNRRKRRTDNGETLKRVKRYKRLPRATAHKKKSNKKAKNKMPNLSPGKRIGPKIPAEKHPFNKTKPFKTDKKNMKSFPAKKANMGVGIGQKPKAEKTQNVKAKRKDSKKVFQQNKTTVPAITLDDLVSVGSFKSTIVKMDIEGWEAKALLKGSLKFLNDFNVKFILMEWSQMRQSSEAKLLKNYLLRNGFFPYKIGINTAMLKGDQSFRWPENVLWKKH